MERMTLSASTIEMARYWKLTIWGRLDNLTRKEEARELVLSNAASKYKMPLNYWVYENLYCPLLVQVYIYSILEVWNKTVLILTGTFKFCSCISYCYLTSDLSELFILVILNSNNLAQKCSVKIVMQSYKCTKWRSLWERLEFPI